MPDTTTQTPQPGDTFWLDGFRYTLTEVKRVVNDQDDIVRLWSFQRPAAADADEAARFKGNPHYFKGGGGVLESELLWIEGADLVSRIRDEAAHLARTGQDGAARRWGTVAGEVQVEHLGTPTGGCWGLEGRFLLRQAMHLTEDAAGVKQLHYAALPDDETAATMAAAILTSTLHAPQPAEG